MKLCSHCKIQKKESEFNKNKTKRDGLQSLCKDCRRQSGHVSYKRNRERVRDWQRASRNKKRQYIAEYLTTHPCIDCGETDPWVLEFDHVRGDKDRAVSLMVTANFSLEHLKREIEKCDIRCANCHRRKTYKELGIGKWKVARPNGLSIVAGCRQDGVSYSSERS